MKSELENLTKKNANLTKSKFEKSLELVDEAERYRTLKAKNNMFDDDEIEVINYPKESSRTTSPAFPK
jgi:hypothetical protein